MKEELLQKKMEEAYEGWKSVQDLEDMSIKNIYECSFRHGVEISEDIQKKENKIEKELIEKELKEIKEKEIDLMVNRFLGWELPKDFLPDGGITFTPPPYPNLHWPVGTNLLNADQTREMIKYILGLNKEILMQNKMEESENQEEPKICLTDGSPVTPEHKEIDPKTKQQKGYVVLCPEERAKGFVRPVRYKYKHIKCGGVTVMGKALSETYARNPKFYSGTFCCHCAGHFPVSEFVWADDGTVVGS